MLRLLDSIIIERSTRFGGSSVLEWRDGFAQYSRPCSTIVGQLSLVPMVLFMHPPPSLPVRTSHTPKLCRQQEGVSSGDP